MLVISHPTGNTFTRALVQTADREKLLARFATTFGFSGSPAWLSRLPQQLRGEFARRSYPVRNDQLYSRPWREVGRLLASRMGWQNLTRHEHGWACVDEVYRDLDRAVARKLPEWSRSHALTAVYAYEDGALHTLRGARALGLCAAYELPIAYWETSTRLLHEEAERWPEWEPTLVGTRDSKRKLQRKTNELQEADVVICPSAFVRDTLPAWARETKRCVVAEFGSPSSESPLLPTEPRRSDKLRLLFAGSLSQRKGLADLFAAMKLLQRRDIELVVMGSPLASLEFYRAQYADFHYEPPRPHAGVLELMRSCDVLVLPSIVEGRALVQQEAMSAGLPLLVTANAGGEDLVEEGRTGFLVPIRSPESLAERIAWLADHREVLPELSRQARRKASRYTWEGYAGKILDALKEATMTSSSEPPDLHGATPSSPSKSACL